MEVRALCIRLLMLVFILLGAHIQNSDAAFRIVSNSLQFLQYETVYLTCEGLDGSTQLRGVRNTARFISAGDTKTPTAAFTIHRAYPADGGEYWCETEGGERSDSVTISVTAGSVILESPVLPVTEGNDVTLSCRNKTTSSNLTADFYKDGLLIRSSSTGEMTIHSVSWSDEGLYKCDISGAGGSPESRLALHRETCPSSDHFIHAVLVLRTVSTIVMVALLLLLVGLLHCGKLRVKQK
ncbi:low affinity immunoglobulin gamma Fc region receptor II-like [Sebastes umbrosus]|uniref:low affinity immunoglobulin gamma Fc region receptor II-like n=1 Tax=Sebastes umbrosus TaxID=72105 RepID=UPI00189D0F62|nr:low affinity immunoglobulin gamma Fc region receptor II-like [Sebastes umbrosus]